MYTTIRHKLCHARKTWSGTLIDPFLLSGVKLCSLEARRVEIDAEWDEPPACLSRAWPYQLSYLLPSHLQSGRWQGSLGVITRPAMFDFSDDGPIVYCIPGAGIARS
jgi:hypothetical protein